MNQPQTHPHPAKKWPEPASQPSESRVWLPSGQMQGRATRLYSKDNMPRSDDAATGRLGAKPFGTRLPDPESGVAPPRCIFNKGFVGAPWLVARQPTSRPRGVMRESLIELAAV